MNTNWNNTVRALLRITRQHWGLENRLATVRPAQRARGNQSKAAGSHAVVGRQ